MGNKQQKPKHRHFDIAPIIAKIRPKATFRKLTDLTKTQQQPSLIRSSLCNYLKTKLIEPSYLDLLNRLTNKTVSNNISLPELTISSLRPKYKTLKNYYPEINFYRQVCQNSREMFEAILLKKILAFKSKNTSFDCPDLSFDSMKTKQGKSEIVFTNLQQLTFKKPVPKIKTPSNFSQMFKLEESKIKEKEKVVSPFITTKSGFRNSKMTTRSNKARSKARQSMTARIRMNTLDSNTDIKMNLAEQYVITTREVHKIKVDIRQLKKSETCHTEVSKGVSCFVKRKPDKRL